MATNETPNATPSPIMPPDISPDDVVRRNILRELPCRITDEEFNRISKERVAKEAERDELLAELALETKKRKAQIEDLEDEIKKKGRELHTGFQDRTVKCIDVFMRAADGVGYIQTLRTDTWKEVERRAASAHETQRHLKGVDDAPGGILDEARKRQRSAQPEPSDVPGDAAASDVPPEASEGESVESGEGGAKPKKRAKKTEH